MSDQDDYDAMARSTASDALLGGNQPWNSGTVWPLVTANVGLSPLIMLHALDENNNPGPILTWRVDDVKGWYGPVVRFRSAQQTIYATIVHCGNTSFTVAESPDEILKLIDQAASPLPAPYVSPDEL